MKNVATLSATNPGSPEKMDSEKLCLPYLPVRSIFPPKQAVVDDEQVTWSESEPSKQTLFLKVKE